MPDFDSEEFPFVLWSRDNAINLVNIKQGFVEPLILRDFASYDKKGQQAFHLDKKVYGTSIHFTAKQVFTDGCVRLNSCKMSIKPDLYKILKEYGTLPKQSTREVLKLMKEHRALVLEHGRLHPPTIPSSEG